MDIQTSRVSRRSVSEIKEDLLNAPGNTDRRGDLELLIEWRLAQVRHQVALDGPGKAYAGFLALTLIARDVGSTPTSGLR